MTEAELLFSHILNCDRLSLYLDNKIILDRDKSLLVSSVLKRRFCAEPLQYILGKTEFMGLEFKVDASVFIPRPETEILVETALRYASTAREVLDVGTGSGCIAVSIAKLLPDTKVSACDVSEAALAVARENAELNQVKINFFRSDLFLTHNSQPTLNLVPTTYDLIISNPPYIPTSQIANLAPEIQYEPVIALDGGSDGLDFYRRIISEASAYLKEDGVLILEIGFGQKGAMKKISENSGAFAMIESLKDYNGIDRVIVMRKTGQNG